MTDVELARACSDLPPPAVLAAASRLWSNVRDRAWLIAVSYHIEGPLVFLRRAGGEWRRADEVAGCWYARDLSNGSWLWRRI